MTLIADSGSTKTDWLLLPSDGTSPITVRTQGINPTHQDADTIARILTTELIPALLTSHSSLSRETLGGMGCQETFPSQGRLEGGLYFYGSGVRPEQSAGLEAVLRSVFPDALHIEAHGDLLGAARALLGTTEGVACILGTGANSGLYDGSTIVVNTPPLGYILGDEGSGAVLGRQFLNALYKGRLPQAVADDFCRDTRLTLPDVIDHVYRQPLPNRWLASLSPFIHAHLHIGEVRSLVVDNFTQFLHHNVLPYRRPDLPVSFVGSIAWHYRAELAEAVGQARLIMGCVLQSPLEGLADYHRKLTGNSSNGT